MSSKPTHAGSKRPTNAPDNRRPSVVVPVMIAGLLIVGAAVAYKVFQNQPPPPAPVAVAAPAPAQPVIRAIKPREDVAESPAPVATVSGTSSAHPASASTAPLEPSVDSRQLMVALASLDIKGPINSDDAKKWRASLQQLVHQGASSVPAIREYLAQNLEVSYAGVTGAEQLGYSSLRAGLLDALAQIGGPESTTAMIQTMQTTLFPSDIAAVAATLEQQAPGQYSADILSAVRAQLGLAAQDQLGNANVGPLFQLLNTAAASGVDVSADLAQYSTKWPYYSAIELSSLPNGAGIPSLIQIAQNEQGTSQSAAAQALAQMAGQNSQALTALVNMAQQGLLSDSMLSQLAPYLAGRENQLGATTNPSGTTSQGLHIASGNQDFIAADLLNTLTPTQASARVTAIDQLIAALPSSDALAQQALQQQKINLNGRQGK